MDSTMLICQDEQRRHVVRREGFNGLDYLEVSEDQRQLTVYFLDRAPKALTPAHVQIRGGRRIRDIQVTDIEIHRRPKESDLDDCLVVTVDKPGDFSSYELCIVAVDAVGRPSAKRHPEFDPRYACLDFSFKAGCPSDLDCKTEPVCPPEERAEPEIDYLAKDYASFRQLMLDRLALLMPEWQERHVPDIGIALVELLAYVGDHLSYYQDAVATEAYLDTARQRISVRRHARLVDYQMHEGCNARAWLHLNTSQDYPLSPHDVYFITGGDLQVDSRMLAPEDLREVPVGQYEVFEPLVDKPAPEFHRQDIRDPAGLAAKLKSGRSALTKHLQKQFSKQTKELLKEYDGSIPLSETLLNALVKELNRLLSGSNFYNEKRFKEIMLSDDIKRLLRQNPRGLALRRLNRLLLEAAYSDEILQSGKIYVYAAHNEIQLYTWGDRECCLLRGATSATLKDGQPAPETDVKQAQSSWKQIGLTAKGEADSAPEQPERELELQSGDFLLLEEIIGPKTGNPVDADPQHRHVVRLTRVEPDVDPLNGQPILHIEWGQADALPFPLCISTVGPPPECELLAAVSVARGNLILVDHGRTIPDEALGIVPVDTTEIPCGDACQPAEIKVVTETFRPSLAEKPLVFREPLVPGEPAFKVPIQAPHAAVPQIDLHSIPPLPDGSGPLFEPDDLEDARTLIRSLLKSSTLAARYLRRQLSPDAQKALETETGADESSASLRDTVAGELEQMLRRWSPRRDLLASGAADRDFVAEVDGQGQAHLRFGNGELGRKPQAGASFLASYRVGGGPVGNVGAETITHIVLRNLKSGLTLKPRNPLPAKGGTAPEPLDDVKRFAPHAFRDELQRAIIAQDYAQIVMRDFETQVQRAAAALRWNGSWYEVLVAVDSRGEIEPDRALLDEIEGNLYRFRRIGHDVTVEPARYVPLDIALRVCVDSDYLRGHVKAELLKVFSNRRLPDGRLGFFHPDNLTFGEGVFLSKLVAAAQAVAGVENVIVERLERLYEGPNQEIEHGVLPLGPLEVARLDNDPSFPENGRLTLNMEGGR